MTKHIITGCLMMLSVLIMASMGTALEVEMIDPHEKPEVCTSCHTSPPTPEEADEGFYNLLGESIDATCHICHPYDCCRINSLKGHNHPSSIDRWDRKKFKEPETLPLHEGMITCTTCHFQHAQDKPGYKMVRIVKVQLDKVDWTGLCVDCHNNYA